MQQTLYLMVSYWLFGLRSNSIGFKINMLIDLAEKEIRHSAVTSGLYRNRDMRMAFRSTRHYNILI